MAAYIVAPSSQPDLSWYPNTAATNHMTADLNNLNLQADEYTGSEQVRVGNGQGLKFVYPICYMFLNSPRIYSIFINLLMTITQLWNFTMIRSISRKKQWELYFFKVVVKMDSTH